MAGTGKTLIGKCIASQCKATFFSISSSSLTSKWVRSFDFLNVQVGDGEKMVRALFAVARVHQPSVIFVDEIDSLLTQRTEGEQEATRRIKTEFLVQFDGCGTNSDDRILMIGATNRPQEIDEAARRRFRKKLYIPLPEDGARRKIILNLLSKQIHSLTDLEVAEIVDKTCGRFIYQNLFNSKDIQDQTWMDWFARLPLVHFTKTNHQDRSEILQILSMRLRLMYDLFLKRIF